MRLDSSFEAKRSVSLAAVPTSNIKRANEKSHIATFQFDYSNGTSRSTHAADYADCVAVAFTINLLERLHGIAHAQIDRQHRHTTGGQQNAFNDFSVFIAPTKYASQTHICTESLSL